MAIVNVKQILDGISERRAANEIASVTPQAAARTWRDKQLKNTDWIVPVTDHPERDSYLTYRTNLRNWPSTDDFPATRPTL